MGVFLHMSIITGQDTSGGVDGIVCEALLIEFSKKIKHSCYRWLNVMDMITNVLPFCDVGTVLFLCSIPPGGHDEPRSCL